jgi:hypothetical protein
MGQVTLLSQQWYLLRTQAPTRDRAPHAVPHAAALTALLCPAAAVWARTM